MLQYEGYLRRHETNEAILALSKQGVPIKQIVKRSGHSRKLVRSVLRGQSSDVFRVRQSSLEEWLPWLDGRWEQGAHNASALWREMREKGFRGQIGVVSEWVRRRRLAERANQSALARTPSARSIARLMTLARNDLSKSDAVLVAAIESNVPDLTTARTLIDDFQTMIRSKAAAKLDSWLKDAETSLVGSFANGVKKDFDAVRNAIVSPWSNGQTEGQITKLKLIKRQMYGRANSICSKRVSLVPPEPKMQRD
jgi:transposase|tara:strand:- start:6100 stop:6858 length:759 start_codon:yes stop_codon:yes gene_type:complete